VVPDPIPYTLLPEDYVYLEGAPIPDEDAIFVGPDGVEIVDDDDDGLIYENTRIRVGLETRDPEFLVLHTTERSLTSRSGDTAERRVNRWTNIWVEAGVREVRPVATHFLIMKEGYVIQFLPIDRSGAHAAVGGGNRGIGIDLEGDVETITELQMGVLTDLVFAEELAGLPILGHRHLDSERRDPDIHDDTGLVTSRFQAFWNVLRERAMAGAGDPSARGLGDEARALLPTFEPFSVLDPLATILLRGRPIYDRTTSFVGKTPLTEIAAGLAAQGNLSTYQAFLNENGITFATAQQLTYLRDAAAVETLATAGVAGYFYNSDGDRTLFAIPPLGFWYNILPALLIVQSVFEHEEEVDPEDVFFEDLDPEDVFFDTSSILDPDDWEIFDAYRPPEYNRAVGGHPKSMHRYNHAIKLRLKTGAHTPMAESPELSANGQAWRNAFLLGHSDGDRYGAYVRFYPMLDTDTVDLYRTHIDAGFFDREAPDGTLQDSLSTRPNSITSEMYVESG
jgi:hypothetical protein